jgi:hypothetical protein
MITTDSIRHASRGLALVAALLLADCSADRLSGTAVEPAQPAGRVAAAPPAPPPVEMAGRWRLVSAAGGACGMTFGGPAGAAEGTIAPEGGCPGNFFTSRRWLFDQGSLVIRDHTGKQLAQLKPGSAGRFEGETEKAERIWLER